MTYVLCIFLMWFVGAIFTLRTTLPVLRKRTELDTDEKWGTAILASVFWPLFWAMIPVLGLIKRARDYFEPPEPGQQN
jgi:hypothetical protein